MLHGTDMTSLMTVLIVAALAWAVIAFNRLVRLRNQARAAWADIDVQLRRRHDLVPQLVAAVKAYVAHERATLEAVTGLRGRAIGLASPAQLGRLEAELQRGLERIFALREGYPELKANENFSQLQRDLVEVEDHLQYARRFYNGAVRDLNTTVQKAPDLLIARATGFSEAEFFQADEEDLPPVRVDLAP
jgi:LemA protein